MDAGWKLFCLSEPWSDLGTRRKAHHIQRHSLNANSIDHRAHPPGGTDSQPSGEQDLRGRIHTTGRTVPDRYHDRQSPALARRNLRRKRFFLSRWKSVAYTLYPEGTIWKADRDGRNRVQLSKEPDNSGNSRWSPDSKQILYGATARNAIYLVSADGEKSQKLLPGDGTDKHDPNWSPDGKSVLFGYGAFITSNMDLRILNLESGEVTIVPGSSAMYSPRWSPDGRYITATFTDSRPSLPVFDFNTQHWSMLPVNGDVEFPSFSKDSRYIYFLRTGRDQGVMRIPVAGGKEERVVDMTNLPITGYWGFSMSLDLSDAPLVTRETGTDDIYSLTLEP